MPTTATRLDAVQNIDGTVDVLINGHHIDGGDNLHVADLVSMLGAYASVNGPLLVTTRLLDGRTTTDRVDRDGTMSPYYPPDTPTPTRRQARAHADASVLFRAMAEEEQGPVVDPTPVFAEPRLQTPFTPRTESRVPTVGEVEMFDVEADIMRELEAQTAPVKTKSNGVALRLGLTVGGILAAGVLLFLFLPQML